VDVHEETKKRKEKVLDPGPVMIAAARVKNGLWVGQTEMIVACVAYSLWALRSIKPISY
jgi:hypothetical protein